MTLPRLCCGCTTNSLGASRNVCLHRMATVMIHIREKIAKENIVRIDDLQQFSFVSLVVGARMKELPKAGCFVSSPLQSQGFFPRAYWTLE
jgi:hypothetical protein